MRKGVFIGFLGLLAVMAAVTTGCGGGDDATASISRSEFIQQGNALCRRGELERGKLLQGAEKLVKPGEELGKAGKEQLVLTAAVTPYRKMTKELEELGAPDGEEEKVEAIIKSMEEAAQKAEDDPLLTLESIAPFVKANKLNQEFGLTSCVV